ncbi:unnamed protein product, partial [Prorocentrum cordatum]
SNYTPGHRACASRETNRDVEGGGTTDEGMMQVELKERGMDDQSTYVNSASTIAQSPSECAQISSSRVHERMLLHRTERPRIRRAPRAPASQAGGSVLKKKKKKNRGRNVEQR